MGYTVDKLFLLMLGEEDIMDKGNQMSKGVIVDMETTGFGREEDRILRLDAVSIVDGVITDVFSEYIRQDAEISPAVTELTGIDNSITDSAKDEAAVIGDFLKFAGDDPIVSFDPEFDMKFLKAACLRCGTSIHNPYINLRDTCKRLIPGIKRYSTETVARELGVEMGVNNEKKEVMILADIFLKLYNTAEYKPD